MGSREILPTGDLLARLRDRWRPSTVRDAERATYSLTESTDEIERSSARTAQALCEVIGDPTATVLDLGCGYGRVAKYVAPHVGRLVLVDVAAEMLELARQRLGAGPNAQYVRCDGESLTGIPNASVDFVYSMFVLQHMPKEIAFRYLLEVNRVLRLGGRSLLQFPNVSSDFYREDFLFNAVCREEGNPGRVRTYSIDEVRWLLATAGFESIVVEEDRETRFFSIHEIVAISRKSGERAIEDLRNRSLQKRGALEHKDAEPERSRR